MPASDMMKYVLLLLLVIPPGLAMKSGAPVWITFTLSAPFLILFFVLDSAAEGPREEKSGGTTSKFIFFAISLTVLYGCVQVFMLLEALFS